MFSPRNRNGILDAYDLNKDPLKPEYLGSWSAGAHDSRPAGDVLYTHGFNQVPARILDVRDPANMKEIGTLPYGNHSGDVYYTPDGRTILLALTEAYSGHVKLYDVTDPSQPTEISSYQSGPFVSVHNVEVKGAYAYVAYYQDQLRILDLTDVTNPVEVGVWDNNPANRGGLFSDAWETIPFHDAVYMNQMDDNVSGPKGTYAIDFFPAFGTAAAGAGGVEPEMWWSFGPPSPGNDRFELRLENGPPHRRFWLLVGQSQTEWRGQPLPQPMSWIGAPNAQLQVSPDFVIPGATNGSGQATISLPVPEGMPYSVFYAQIVVKDPGAPNAGGFSSTRPGKLVVW